MNGCRILRPIDNEAGQSVSVHGIDGSQYISVISKGKTVLCVVSKPAIRIANHVSRCVDGQGVGRADL